MLGGIIILIGMQISGKLAAKALRSLPHLFPGAGKPFRYLTSITLLATYIYCSFTCVLLGAVANGSALDNATILAAYKFMGRASLISLLAASLGGAVSRLLNPERSKPKQIPDDRKVTFDISSLLEKSDYIQSKCLNEQYMDTDGTTPAGWIHSLPLKRAHGHGLDPANWDLSEEDISLIRAFNEDLRNYARSILRLCRSRRSSLTVKHRLASVTDFLPPWVAFPLYPFGSPAWSAGLGEEYMDAHLLFLSSLSIEEFKEYKAAFPIPDYFSSPAQN